MFASVSKLATDGSMVSADSLTPSQRAELGMSVARAPDSCRIGFMENFLGPGINTRLLHLTGHAAFATQTLPYGAIVATFGGTASTRAGLNRFTPDRVSRSIQVDDDLFFVGPVTPEPGDFLNHSCAPNCGMRNATQVVAMREIAAGEELTFDYAMSDTAPYDEFECHCGTELCRGFVRATDWQREDLQARYEGWFAPHVVRLIRATHSRRVLRKSEVEKMMDLYDRDPIAALTNALRITTGRTHASWETLIESLPERDALTIGNVHSLDRLATELNETRTVRLDERVHPATHQP